MSYKLIFPKHAIKYWLIVFFGLFFIGVTAQAQTKNSITSASSKVSPAYDTYKVKKGETLFSISKKFHTTVDHLKKINPGIKLTDLTAGTKIIVPVVTAEMRKKDKERTKMLKHAIVYTPQKKETLYSIAKKYNTDVKKLMEWNDLAGADIAAGQELIVGFKDPGYAPESAASTGSSSHAKEADKVSSKSSKSKSEGSANRETIVLENGAGTWIKNVDDDGNFYALHPTAPIGTHISVTNLMNSKTVTVKVIGKLPATEENQNTIIKLSTSAAKALNILDQKFRVELQYPTE